VPETGSLSLVGTGLIGLAALVRRRLSHLTVQKPLFHRSLGAVVLGFRFLTYRKIKIRA
jgi:hypothetical protein